MIAKKIKSLIPVSLKTKIKNFFFSRKDPEWLKYNNSKKKIYIFLSGFYQNLGDMALTYAQKKFLTDLYPDADVITIPSYLTYQSVKTIKTFIKPEDIVTIIGGGNMDDMYVSLEEARLHVVKNFPNNKIVSFPQTFAFSDTKYGKKRKNISKKIYSQHKNLTIFVREPYSYKRITEEFPNIKVGYCPDIVLSLDEIEPKFNRTDILCCLRNDKEQLTTNDEKNKIVTALKNEFGRVLEIDTVDVTKDECTMQEYENTLRNFWNIIKSCKVVVTDRLHCMIFCYITGTPCVVMDSSNHKVSGVYEKWLFDSTYIKMLYNNDEKFVLDLCKQLSGTNFDIKGNQILDCFTSLEKALKD